MSKSPRFFISPEQVRDQHITISGEDAHHIVKVLRMKTGDELLLCDGRGIEYQAKIMQIGWQGSRSVGWSAPTRSRARSSTG